MRPNSTATCNRCAVTRGKYEALIDPPLWGYIDRINEAYPPDVVNLSIEKQRAIYDAIARDFHAGHPNGVEAGDSAVSLPDRAIPIRRYRMQ